MLFNCSNLKGENPMQLKRFTVIGDGESTRLLVKLDASPVGMEFRGGKLPAYAFLRQSYGTGDILLDMHDSVMEVSFDHPPAEGERIEADIEFFYQGEPETGAGKAGLPCN